MATFKALKCDHCKVVTFATTKRKLFDALTGKPVGKEKDLCDKHAKLLDCIFTAPTEAEVDLTRHGGVRKRKAAQRSFKQYVDEVTEYAVRHPDKPFSVKGLMKTLKVEQPAYSTFARAVSLLRERRVIRATGGMRNREYHYIQQKRQRTSGTVKPRKPAISNPPAGANGQVPAGL